MDEVEWILGFHGTTSKKASDILTEGFSPSEGEGEWLGKGAYFFEDAPRLAFFYARKKYGPEADVAVIQSKIRLEPGYIMNLLSTRWNAVLDFAYRDVKKAFISLGWSLPDEGGDRENDHFLDCIVVNRACTILKEEADINIKGVRAPFDDPHPIYDGSHLKMYSHVQIAVRDESLIREPKLIEVPDRVAVPH